MAFKPFQAPSIKEKVEKIAEEKKKREERNLAIQLRDLIAKIDFASEDRRQELIRVSPLMET